MNTVQNIECVTDLSLLVNTSLVDVVADKIRQNIYTGKYEAGKKLIVRELSEEFGVSHTPVKDALNRLISEGYVEALPRRSMVVRTYTNAELLDALEARMMCEVFYADAIIEMSKGHPELVKELKEVMATTRRLVAERGEHLKEKFDLENTLLEIRKIVGQDADVQIEYVEDIPVLASGKRKMVICEWKKS